MKSAAIKLLKTKPHWVALFILISLTCVLLISRWGIYDHDEKLPEKVTLNIQCDKGLYFKVEQSFVSTIPTSTDNVIKNIYCNVPVSRFYNKEFKPIQSGTLQLRLKKRFRGFCDEEFWYLQIKARQNNDGWDKSDYKLGPDNHHLTISRYNKNAMKVSDTIHYIVWPNLTYIHDGAADSTRFEELILAQEATRSYFSFHNQSQDTIQILCNE